MLLACYNHAMGALQVKNIPPDLHDAIRRRAAEQGLTVSGYVLELVRRDLAVPSQREWFAELAEREPVERADILEALDAARTARDEELRGR
jgi:plasmid stability protein